MSKYVPPRPKQPEFTAAEKVVNFIGRVVGYLIAAVVVGLLFTVLWNYGVTEVIQNLGGPDGNINVVAGFLTYLFLVPFYRHASRK